MVADARVRRRQTGTEQRPRRRARAGAAGLVVGLPVGGGGGGAAHRRALHRRTARVDGEVVDELPVDLDALVATSVWMAEQLSRPAPSRVVKALAGG